MKFGFNFITDEAREKLEELGVAHKREQTVPGALYWFVWTEAYDLKEQAFHDNPLNDEVVSYSGDRKEFKAQGTRVFKFPGTGEYLILIKDVVFRKRAKFTYDHRFTPPTVEEKSVLDYDPDDSTFRDMLYNFPAMADSMVFL